MYILIKVSNVPKDHIESEELESWRHQGNHGQYVPANNDPYNQQGYYGTTTGAQFQYPPFGVGDGTWSSGNENLAILGGYAAAHENYNADGNAWFTIFFFFFFSLFLFFFLCLFDSFCFFLFCNIGNS